MSDKKLTYRQNSGISFVAQDDPPFIKEMKKKIGYREGPKLEDKFVDEDGPEGCDDPETELLRTREEDRPQVVVLNPETDLSQEDLDKVLQSKQKEEDDQKIAEGKIVFKKPVKRAAEEAKEVEEKKKREEKKVDAKPQSRLLSFGDDEEEDE